MCKHHRLIFISKQTVTGVGIDSYRAHASVCAECGQFLVWINGEQMTFQLVSDEQVEAAGVYAKMLKESEQCKTPSATSPSPPSSSLPASTPSSAIVNRIYKQADASAEPFEREL